MSDFIIKEFTLCQFTMSLCPFGDMSLCPIGHALLLSALSGMATGTPAFSLFTSACVSEDTAALVE